MITQRIARPVLLTCSVALFSACGGSDDGPAAASSRDAQDVCTQLQGASLGGAAQMATTMVAATATVPAYCKVTGLLLPKLNFELRVPDRWNGKLYYQGGGGFNGSVPTLNAQSIQALKSGYVAVFSDSGHQASTLDATWALNDAYAAELWGSL